MSNKGKHIDKEQYLRYLRGELTGKEAHELEKRSLEDSFEADALEGMESIALEQLAQDLEALSEKVKKPALFPYRMVAAAASIVLICFVGAWLYWSPDQQDEAMIAAEISKDQEADSTNMILEINGDSIGSLIAMEVEEAGRGMVAEPKIPAISSVHIDPKPVEIAAKTEIPEVEEVADEFLADMVVEEEIAIVEKESVSEISHPAPSMAKSAPMGRAKMASGAMSDQKSLSALIAGEVTDNTGLPMIGATVTIKAEDGHVQTGKQGSFSIAVSSEPPFAFRLSYPGRASKDTLINEAGANVKLALQPSNRFIVEAFVTDLPLSSSVVMRDFQPAQPREGLGHFDQYIKSSVSGFPSIVGGTLILRGDVGADGRAGNWSVLGSVESGQDQQLLSLVAGYAAWSPSLVDGKAVVSTVIVKIRFL